MTKTKKIKVQYSSRCNSRSYWGGSSYTSYPKIQMEGKWLEALGFNVGDHVKVDYEEGRITLSLVKPEPVMMVAEPPADYGKTKRSRKAKA